MHADSERLPRYLKTPQRCACCDVQYNIMPDHFSRTCAHARVFCSSAPGALTVAAHRQLVSIINECVVHIAGSFGATESALRNRTVSVRDVAYTPRPPGGRQRRRCQRLEAFTGRRCLFTGHRCSFPSRGLYTQYLLVSRSVERSRCSR